jgi:hypothetical protein
MSEADLQIDYSRSFERRMRVVHRLSALLAVLLLAAGLAGVFGEGPLAHASAQSAGGRLQVDYDRFVRTAASTSLQLTLSGAHGQTSFALSNAFLQNAGSPQISPQPSNATVLPDRTVYSLPVRSSGQVQVSFSPETIGVHRVTVWAGRDLVTFRQFTYP